MFDIIAHYMPTMLKKLGALTGIDAAAVALDDIETLNMFAGGDTLGEFEDPLVREMIRVARPKTFDDYVQISGLHHGAGVWFDNAEELIKSGVATISEVIALRDEIMIFLMDKGIGREVAFGIMEQVRKGRGLTLEQEDTMKNAGVPDWYIGSCQKINYLFPKAHVVGYTMMTFRLGWYKAHYPREFYEVYSNPYYRT
jgi:DNA polymerase-3 subunit alpha (Gram-positive type)